MKLQLSTLSILTVIAVATPAFAAPVFDITFEKPAYSAGDAYDAKTDSGKLTGASPAHLTTFEIKAGAPENEWTATVAKASPSSANHWLRFDIPAGSSFSGRVQGWAPDRIVGDEKGTWVLQFDYTPLIGEGGFLGGWTLVSRDGSQLSTHSNNHPLFLNGFGGGEPFIVGETYRLKVEVDLNSTLPIAFRAYVNGTQIFAGPAINNTNGVGGFAFHISGQINQTFTEAKSFALDNIKFGPLGSFQ
ncbi:MAG: hypothetical protein ABII82_05850 [Verrucomicrobiota bacterium]